MPIQKGCTHCGSDQHNTTDCPMMVSKGWSKEKPTSPGAYYARGFRLGEEDYRPALVDVALDDDGELVCNIHLSNSNDDLCQWSLLADCSERFEWLGPLAASPAPEVPGPRLPEQPKPRPYDYQSVPEVAGIGRDADQLALDAATDIMALMYGPTPAGGSVQLLAQVQCRVLDAIKAAHRPVPQQGDEAHEAAAILRNMIDSIGVHGNYSPESTLNFLNQALGSIEAALSTLGEGERT